MKKGMDVSYYQGDIDFTLVKANGIEFAIIRCGYRNSTDKKFFEYVKNAKAAHLPILGVYFFSYALNEEQAREEARLCLENMELAGLGKDVIVFYDFEYDTVTKAAANGVLLNRPECNAHTLAFCEEVKKFGYLPGVYTNLDYYKNWYDKSVLEKYYVWLADYTGGPDFDCLVQQYTSKGSVPGIKGAVDLDYYYGDDFKMNEPVVMRSRSEVVNLGRSWLGLNEADGSYKKIIDIYNSFAGPFPRGVKMQYGWAWCACTWSALAIALGYTDIMPIEISCGELIERAKTMGIWVEEDDYIPSPGDAILYDWDDNGIGDNTGWPDHVGMVDYVNVEAGYMTVIEGNYSDSVKKRTISINGKYIRGFITPKYTDDGVVFESSATETKDVGSLAREVISGLWGNGEQRKKALEAAGFNYSEVQSRVNEILNGDADKAASEPTVSAPATGKVEATCYARSEDRSLAGTYVTTANLYCRNDAGNNKKALCLIPKGTKVQNYGFYTAFNGTKWLLIQFTLNGIKYTGFSSSLYLKK